MKRPKNSGGGHKKDLCSSGQDTPGHDGDIMDWEELEEEYYKDFDSRADLNEPPFSRYYPYNQRNKNEGPLPDENQTETSSLHKNTSRDLEESEQQEAAFEDGSYPGGNGSSYREEKMRVTNVRRGSHKRKKDSFFKANKAKQGKRLPPETRAVPCPDNKCGDCVSFRDCAECQNNQVWDEKDGDFKRCYHDYKDLESRGHYDGTWDDHPENFDPETFERIQDQKRLNAEINEDMEREKEEMERRGEELEKNSQSVYEYYKDKYGGDYEDYDEEGDEDDEDKEEDNERDFYR